MAVVQQIVQICLFSVDIWYIHVYVIARGERNAVTVACHVISRSVIQTINRPTSQDVLRLPQRDVHYARKDASCHTQREPQCNALTIVQHIVQPKPSKTIPELNRIGKVLVHKKQLYFWRDSCLSFEPVHEISNNVACATSKGSDQPAHTRSLIRAFASRLSII